MKKLIKTGMATVLLFAYGCSEPNSQTYPDVTIFTAKDIVTVNANTPYAKAVAVKDGKIIDLGSIETLVAQYSGCLLYTSPSPRD